VAEGERRRVFVWKFFFFLEKKFSATRAEGVPTVPLYVKRVKEGGDEEEEENFTRRLTVIN
jgi:hypothetical protein